MRFTRHRLITLLIALATFVAVLAPTPALAGRGYEAKRELTVMSRNLYLGADLNEAIAAGLVGDAEGFIGAVAAIYQSVMDTDFDRRSEAIVDEIEKSLPDIVGLQEVSKWTVSSEALPSYDFLSILLADLREAGLNYEVAAVSENAHLPGFPLLQCSLTCTVTFDDRDVILVADTPGLKITDAADAGYIAQVEFTIFPETPQEQIVSFDRGWVYVDGKYRGRQFRFINTHLEVEGFAPVQETQAAEFLAGPARTRGTVIAVGDFNSAADGTTTASYEMLTKRWRFRDAWRVNRGDSGFTCCFDSGLAIAGSELTSRIDLVLVRGWAWARSAAVVGDEQFQGSAPLWASDHAGVVATIRLF